MTMTRKHLPRRTFLRGLGVSLALPLLDGMIPAFASPREIAATRIRRLGVVYVPNGMFMKNWTPAAGEGLEITPTLEPLAPFRERLTVVSGLCAEEGIAQPGEGAGDHARAAAAYLTGVHPRKTEGHDIRAGVSMDQIAARALGEQTQLASLELSLENAARAGSCDPGYACAYANTLCWSSETTPLPMVSDPRVVFERLFGTGGSTDPAAWLASRQADRSLLDMVVDKLGRLRRELGPRDRVKLDEYLTAVRDIERRIQKAEQQAARELPAVEQPAGVPSSFEEHARLMFDLQALAYQADLTRVITFMVGHETSNRAYPEIGVPDAHHSLSHHGGNVEMISRLVKVDQYITKVFGQYVEKLASTREGDGTLLDSLTLLYGSGMSDGNTHDHHNLPTLLVGGGAGWLRGGRHVRVPKDTPITNLYVTVLDRLGVPVDRLGDSTGNLPYLSEV
jgi:hypothetical protein